MGAKSGHGPNKLPESCPCSTTGNGEVPFERIVPKSVHTITIWKTKEHYKNGSMQI
jgi:hypothetical protein